MDSRPLNKLPGEAGMKKVLIRIIPHHPAENLDPLSRINLSRIHPIEYNVKIKNIRLVEKESLCKL